MSFKIFSLQLLGKIKPVETIEKNRKTLADDFAEFQRVESSDELKLYFELEKEVNSAEFKKNKAAIEVLHFKGSREFNLLKEFQSLEKKHSIRDFLKVEGSSDLERFKKLKNAEKTAEYNELKKYVNDGRFAKEKKEILTQVYKGSPEEKQAKEFHKLEKSKQISVWNELQNPARLKGEESAKHSKKLEIFNETKSSSLLKRYLELKELINSDSFKKRVAFLQDQTKFENSEANRKFKRYKQLENDPDISFFTGFEKSKLYKNYLAVVDSADLKRYRELKQTTTSAEFAERKKYLEDPKKWEKTEEFKRQQQYSELKKQPHLVKYFKNKGTSVFDFLRNWEVVFEDDFSAAKPDNDKWSFTSLAADKMLGDNFSLTGDLHHFTAGKNLKTASKLTIEVRKEKATGKIWQMPSGFVQATLDYTSGLISSWKSFSAEDGIFEAKIRFNPFSQVVSSFYLAGETDQPRVSLLEMGAKNRLGFISLKNAKAQVEGLDISNLNSNKWYIFSVEKNGSQFTWKINETDVFSGQSSELNKKLHLNASSIVVEEVPASQLPASFEIEWVKCWRKRK